MYCYLYFLGAHAPTAGLEPATIRLTAECSTIELGRNKFVWAMHKMAARPLDLQFAASINCILPCSLFQSPTQTGTSCHLYKLHQPTAQSVKLLILPCETPHQHGPFFVMAHSPLGKISKPSECCLLSNLHQQTVRV